MMMLTEEENEKRQRDWVATFLCLIVLSASFVALRLFVKLKIVRNLGVDDITSVVALVSLRLCLEESPAMSPANTWHQGVRNRHDCFLLFR